MVYNFSHIYKQLEYSHYSTFSITQTPNMEFLGTETSVILYFFFIISRCVQDQWIKLAS